MIVLRRSNCIVLLHTYYMYIEYSAINDFVACSLLSSAITANPSSGLSSIVRIASIADY